MVTSTSEQSAHPSCSGEDIGTFILLLSCLDRSLFRELLHPHLPEEPTSALANGSVSL